MHWLRWTIVILALVEGGWFAFDGGHALVTGDYVTPKSGQYAGRLGPWSKLLAATGIDPRSTLMKVIHVALGATWILVIARYIWGRPWAWWGMILCAAAGLWYLPFGTLLSLIQIVLLILPTIRKLPRARSAENAPGAK